MAATPSTMLPLGTPAPAFALHDAVSGRKVALADFAGKPLVVMFICNHCPFVKWVRSEVARLAKDYAGKGVGFVAISSNDIVTHPDDSPAKMKDEAREAGYTFPYLFDETQAVAKAYQAACTPDFYVFDRQHRLVYRGQLDDSRPTGRSSAPAGTGLPVTGKDVRAALDAVLAGTPVSAEQKASIGCNIKWKKGNEPEFFRV
jgi:thiol-disulfide isomerase/thioredoxin